MRVFRLVFAIAGLAIAGAACAQVRYGPPPPPPGPGYAGQTINCGSPDYHFQRCRIPPGWRGVQLIRQTSSSACVRGRTWGHERGSIWVDQGCAGIFAPGNHAGGGWRPGPGWDRDFPVSCGSPQYHYNFCQVDVGARGRVMLQRQLSDTRCVEGRNWGWNRAGIWVDQGCSAQFLVVRRW